MGHRFTYVVSPEEERENLTVEWFLRRHGYSRHIITGLKRTEDGIFRNGVRAWTSQAVHAGDVIETHLVETEPSDGILPRPVPFSVVYEDDDILVVDKPADTPIHPSIGNYENTLANGIAWYFEQKGEPFVYRCINRLDRDTTGLIVLAKHALSAAVLSQAMRSREIHRTYQAFALGETAASGTIDAPIARLDGSLIQRTVDFASGEMTEEQIRVSVEEKALFPAYVSSLGLKDENGAPLTLDADGEGSLKEYVKHIVMESAQRALDGGVDLADKTWLTIENGKVQSMDFAAYVKDITRMKTAPAFDALDLESPENDLFGNEMTNCRHFTEYSAANTKVQGERAEKKIVKMLNPMEYVMDEMAQKAHHFRIRHGECDRDTSLVISAMLVLKLREAGCEVDYHSPWNTPHAGDYDLDELFAWIDGICG